MQTETQLQPLTVSTSTEWNLQFRTWLFNRKPRLASKSITTAEGHVRVFAKWHEATFNETFHPQAITNYDLHLYRAYSLDQAKVAARTWNSRRWALDLFCKWINMPELMDDIEEKSAGRASTKHRSLTVNEYHRLMRKLSWMAEPRHSDTVFAFHKSLRTCAEIMLMNQAGLRVGEVVSIEVGDITIKERVGEITVRNGKGSKERIVHLNSVTKEAVANWLEVNSFSATDSLFEGRTERSVQRDVDEVFAQICISDGTCHWLRYDLAKRLERAGKPIELIRDVLGHATIEQTRRYLRSSSEDIQSALEEVM